MGGGYKFSILFSYVNDYGNQNFSVITLIAERKKKQITGIIEKLPYYNKPMIIKNKDMLKGGLTKDKLTPKKESSSTSYVDPLIILKTRYAQGEITKKMFEEMKKNLE
ncbi:MAG: SHOCT domain-containing protein [Nitrosopumilus sp.]|nr:SHOCT domain-containing protein [Nitrosopumilus sp.]